MATLPNRRFPRPPVVGSPLRLPGERVLYGSIGIVTVLLAWELVSRLGIVKRSLLSSPTLILGSAVADFGSGSILPNIGVSLYEWAAGFAISLAIGIPLGLAIGWFRRLDYLASVLLTAAYATPKVALFPLVTLVAGIGMESKIIVVVLLAVFPIAVMTISGARSVDKGHLETAQSFGASQGLVFRSIVLPSTIPFILSGVRIGAGRALVGVVVAEFLAANEGIGYYVNFYGSMLDTSRVMLGIVLLGAFGIAVGEIVRVFEHKFDVWRPAIH